MGTETTTLGNAILFTILGLGSLLFLLGGIGWITDKRSAPAFLFYSSFLFAAALVIR